MKEKIWKNLAAANYDNYFITAEIVSEDASYPQSLDSFIRKKLESINYNAISGRRFIFREDSWKIYLTFFPKNEVVSEKYALKNKAFKETNNH